MSTFWKKLTLAAKNMTVRGIVVSVLCAALAAAMTGITFASNAVYIHDGKDVTLVYTTEKDPKDILKSQNLTLGANDKLEFTGFENNTGTITIKRAFDVTVTADGETKTVSLAEGTVADALTLAGVTMADEDRINVAPTEALHAGTAIVVNRVTTRMVNKTEEVPFTTTEKKTPMLKKGTTKVVTPGVAGEVVSVSKETLVDGKVVKSEFVEKKQTKAPVNQEVLVGTAPKTPVSQVTPPSSLELTTNGVPGNYTKVLTGKAAAYSARKGAKTASGRYAIPGHVAVDPRIIPYGTKLYIATPDNSFVYGYAVAADTGTALREGKIIVDLFFNTYEETCRFGIKNVNIYVLE